MAGPTVAVASPSTLPWDANQAALDIPRAPRALVIVMLVGVPVSAASPVELPVAVVDVEGELVSDVRRVA